jgi:hypothetical protein
LSDESRPGADPARGEWPQVLSFEAALHSSDVPVRTVAKILDLVCALVRVDVALFYTVNDRLEKYAVEPIVAKVNHPPSLDIEGVLRQYRERWAERDPFTPSRAARSDITVLSSQDLGDDVDRARSATGGSLFPAAEMYLRTGGKLVAAIAVFPDPSVPELSLSEIWMLRDLHGLCQYTYALATCTESAWIRNGGLSSEFMNL